jgi:putative addiction module CopG family antidote
MTINLPAELRALVARKVADGTFDTEEAVVEAALGLLAEREERENANVARLRTLADAGFADLDAGRASRVTAAEIKAMARNRYLS